MARLQSAGRKTAPLYTSPPSLGLAEIKTQARRRSEGHPFSVQTLPGESVRLYSVGADNAVSHFV